MTSLQASSSSSWTISLRTMKGHTLARSLMEAAKGRAPWCWLGMVSRTRLELWGRTRHESLKATCLATACLHACQRVLNTLQRRISEPRERSPGQHHFIFFHELWFRSHSGDPQPGSSKDRIYRSNGRRFDLLITLCLCVSVCAHSFQSGAGWGWLPEERIHQSQGG